MKKFFTLMMMCIMAIAANAQITIYVQCDQAPFIWSWGAANGTDYNVGEWPGTNQLTGTWTDSDTGEKFWTYTFPQDALPISFLFNNGETTGTKQTADVNSVTTDRYFILKWDDGTGAVSFVDVSEDWGVTLPDAVVEKVTLAGNHNDWDGESQEFNVVEAGKVFSITINTNDYSIDENLWQFKFRPNAKDWVGYWDIYYDEVPVEGKTSKEEAPTWLSVSDDGNFLIDLEATDFRVFTLTATWGGGKDAGKNWQFTATAEDGTGVNNVKANLANQSVIYNLQGQRIADNYRGIAIRNGKKVVLK